MNAHCIEAVLLFVVKQQVINYNINFQFFVVHFLTTVLVTRASNFRLPRAPDTLEPALHRSQGAERQCHQNKIHFIKKCSFNNESELMKALVIKRSKSKPFLNKKTWLFTWSEVASARVSLRDAVLNDATLVTGVHFREI